jgi:hypothetical protein
MKPQKATKGHTYRQKSQKTDEKHKNTKIKAREIVTNLKNKLSKKSKMYITIQVQFSEKQDNKSAKKTKVKEKQEQ